jgi:hypothetical protein
MRLKLTEAALHAATRIDSAFAEAWYNLGNLLDDQGRSDAAIECLTTVTMFINVQRRQITGGAISLSTASPNGLAAHADHSNSARQQHLSV